MTDSFATSRLSRFFVSALLMLGMVTAVGVAAAAGPAQAHDELISSKPTSNAKLETAPKQITLTFSSEPMKDSAKIIAATRAGDPVVLDEPKINGKVVTVPWPTTEAGTYGVNWRVVSSDGHPIDGAFAFQVLTSGSSSAAPVESPSDSTATTEASPAPAADDSSSRVGGMIAGLAIVVVAATILVAILVRRRRDKGDDVS